jgi:CRP-like cAMP-binding protein
VPGGIQIEPALSRQDLAEWAGTTLYTVSRLLNAWRKRGLVEVGRRRVVLRRPRGLEVLAAGG